MRQNGFDLFYLHKMLWEIVIPSRWKKKTTDKVFRGTNFAFYRPISITLLQSKLLKVS
jgi:hypothetical protein